MAKLSLADARARIDSAIAAAEALNVACSIAVVGPTGDLVSFVRQDTAMSGSAELAINNAFTAQIFDKRTDALATLAQPGAELFGIQHSHGGRIVVFGGGIPIRFESETIGVSGGSVTEDVSIAEAGAFPMQGRSRTG